MNNNIIYSIDFGLKRMGIAKILNNIVIPLEPIIRKNRKQASKELHNIITNNNTISSDKITLVIGMPIEDYKDSIILESKSSEFKRRVLHFLDLINFKGEIIFIDENLSSIEAQEKLKDRNHKVRKNSIKNGNLDSLSACIILERYIESNTKNTNTAPYSTKLDSKNIIDTKTSPHIPVLLNEVLDTFNIILDSKKQDIPVIIDCTLGFGGHSRMLLNKYNNLHIIGIDKDLDSIKYNEKLKNEFKERIDIYQGSFANLLPQILKSLESKQMKLYGILADIGVSSMQFDNLERGFSFRSNIIDMRMDKSQNLNAQYILNHYNGMELERIFRDFGEIKEYKKLVKLILQEREKQSKDVNITPEIMQNIALKINSKASLHPLTLIYQALRIEVNNELEELQTLLNECQNLKNAILCIISFHSLEDRIIKETFKKWAKTCICDKDAIKCTCGNNHSKGQILYKKPLIASKEELQINPRARSAKLRAFYFV